MPLKLSRSLFPHRKHPSHNLSAETRVSVRRRRKSRICRPINLICRNSAIRGLETSRQQAAFSESETRTFALRQWLRNARPKIRVIKSISRHLHCKSRSRFGNSDVCSFRYWADFSEGLSNPKVRRWSRFVR